MSADLLRRAARRIRETSGDASPTAVLAFGFAGTRKVLDDTDNPIRRPRQLAAIDHYAVWTTQASLAVADVFEAWERMARLDPDLLNRVGGPETLRLARLLVGEEGPTDE